MFCTCCQLQQTRSSPCLFTQRPRPAPQGGVLFPSPALASRAACLPSCWSSVSLHPRCWCILTPHLSSLPFLPLFLLPGHQPPPVCIHGPLVSSWDLLSGTPGWLVQLPATCLYSQVLLVVLSMDRRGAHCHLSPDFLTEPQPSSVSPVQSPMPPDPPSR